MDPYSPIYMWLSYDPISMHKYLYILKSQTRQSYNQDIFSIIKQCDLPFIRRRIQILDDAAHGLAYLHCSGVTSKPLLHLDVKR